MNSVLQLARHILQFQPEKDPARLCFYQFLIHHCEPQEPVGPETLDRFNRHALSFEHWRKHSKTLMQEVQYLLQHFSQSYQVDIQFKDITLPDRWQVIRLNNKIDVLKVLENHFTADHKSRLIPDPGSDSFLWIQQEDDFGITVTQLEPNFIVNSNGYLEPLNTEFKLKYSQDLRLRFQEIQYVKVNTNLVCRFIISGDGAHGSLLRGFTFQRAKVLQGGRLQSYPQIFYAIKRLEQTYVDRKSDPVYKELTQVLEKSVELINMRHPEAKSFSQTALERGEQALENMFPNDSMLQLLIQTLKQSQSRAVQVSLDDTKGVRKWSQNANQLLVD